MSEAALAPGLYRLQGRVYAIVYVHEHGIASGVLEDGQEFSKRATEFADAEQLSSAALFDQAHALWSACSRARNAGLQDRADAYETVERLRKRWCDAVGASLSLATLLGAQP